LDFVDDDEVMIDKMFLPLSFIHSGPFIAVDGSLFGNNSGCFEINDFINEYAVIKLDELGE
jgi:hypothetical protein